MFLINVFTITNTPITEEQTRFRSANHKVYTVANNKIAMYNGDENEIQDIDGVATYPHGSNIVIRKHLNVKEIPNSFEELKQIHKGFIEN